MASKSIPAVACPIEEKARATFDVLRPALAAIVPGFDDFVYLDFESADLRDLLAKNAVKVVLLDLSSQGELVWDILKLLCIDSEIRSLVVGKTFDKKITARAARLGAVNFPHPCNWELVAAFIADTLDVRHDSATTLDDDPVTTLISQVCGLHLLSQRRILNTVLQKQEPDERKKILSTIEESTKNKSYASWIANPGTKSNPQYYLKELKSSKKKSGETDCSRRKRESIVMPLGSKDPLTLPQEEEDPRELTKSTYKIDILSPSRVLCVDDEKNYLNYLYVLMRLLAKELCYPVDFIFCDTGEAALDTLRANPTIQVALLDLGVPNVNGWVILEELRSFPQIRPIVLSQQFTSDNVAQASRYGATFFPKEYNVRAVALHISTFLNYRELPQDPVAEQQLVSEIATLNVLQRRDVMLGVIRQQPCKLVGETYREMQKAARTAALQEEVRAISLDSGRLIGSSRVVDDSIPAIVCPSEEKVRATFSTLQAALVRKIPEFRDFVYLDFESEDLRTRLARYRAKVVLLDLNSQGDRVWDVLKLLCIDPRIRTLVIGDTFDENLVARAARLGAVYFPQPCSLELITAFVTHALNFRADRDDIPDKDPITLLIRQICGLHIFSQRRILNGILRQQAPDRHNETLALLEEAKDFDSYRSRIASGGSKSSPYFYLKIPYADEKNKTKYITAKNFGSRDPRSLPQGETDPRQLGGYSGKFDSLFPCRILCVDDSRENLQFLFGLKSLLEKDLPYSIDFIFCDRGRAALDALKKNPTVQIAIIDLDMPDVNGWLILDAIRSSFQVRPIVMSRYFERDNVARASSYGAVFFQTNYSLRAIELHISTLLQYQELYENEALEAKLISEISALKLESQQKLACEIMRQQPSELVAETYRWLYAADKISGLEGQIVVGGAATQRYYYLRYRNPDPTNGPSNKSIILGRTDPIHLKDDRINARRKAAGV